MKKNILSLLALCFALVACKEDKKNDMIIGTSADYKPFMFYDNGVLSGFEKDLMDEIAQRMGRNPVYKDLSFDGLVGGLQANRLNIVAACMTHTEEREKNVDFSEPYYADFPVLLVSKESSAQSVEDLKNASIGVQMGTIHDARANEWKDQGKVAKVISLSKIPELLQEWKNTRVDAVLMGSVEAANIVESQPDIKIVPLQGLGQSKVSFALPKGSKETSEINATLNQIREDGTMEKLRAKWRL